ncbi:MAG: hypothetical protein J3T61_03740 [Candidatus Brocadiales bacterium]|nr:hypothetical protein [Candidatus Bathyanammoxibius sp.]
MIARDPGPREIETGEPLCGPSGFVLDKWVFPAAGLSGVPHLKGNVLRCHTPSNKYPTGKLRKSAEINCRQYDFDHSQFDYTLVTLHPSGVMRNKYDPLPLLVRDFERVKWLIDQDHRVLVLMGSEAMEMFAPHLKQAKAGVSGWRGHWWRTRPIPPIDTEWIPFRPFGAQLFKDYLDAPLISFDLEWNITTKEITLISLATPEFAGCWHWEDVDKTILYQIFRKAGRVVGYNILGHQSDLDVLRLNNFQFEGKVGDVMLAFHLLWPQLASLGHLDLWTCVSLHTMVPNWKMCRGEGHCFGPCPKHDEEGYNLMDAYQCGLAWKVMEPELMLRGLL